ncbi:zinc finger domain-containing protein [Pseudonocardia sp.]|uniref:zinc finger domain-containing protein n=1 Tax=Pseudonocardia sp. TaxID=60912 RepID=UPI003D0EBF47
MSAEQRADRACPICWHTFTPLSRRHTYYSDRCRKTAHQRRLAEQPPPTTTPATDPPPGPERAATRPCPHCGETITIVALLTTPQAARPTLPAVGDSVIPLRRHDRQAARHTWGRCSSNSGNFQPASSPLRDRCPVLLLSSTQRESGQADCQLAGGSASDILEAEGLVSGLPRPHLACADRETP